MSTIVTRIGKGTPLTWAEGDANFTNLNTDKVELTNLANTASTTLGDFLVGVKRTETGAVATTQHAINQARPIYVPADFTGGTFTQALQAALATGTYANIVLTSSGTLTATCVLQASTKLDLGGYTINKGFNGDMFDMSANSCRLVNGDLYGDGATYTGRGIIIGTAGEYGQQILGVQIRNMDGYCLEFTTENAGTRCKVDGLGQDVWQRQNPSLPSIKLPNNETTVQGTRSFSNLQAGGGVLIDPSGGNMTWMTACNSIGITFTANSKYFHMNNCRIAGDLAMNGNTINIHNCAIGGAVSINGTFTSLINNSISGTTTVLGSASVSRIAANYCASSFTVNSGATLITADDTNYWQGGFADNSANATNYLYTEADFTPTWTGDATPPALGNGTITGRYTRRGKHIRISIQLTMGSTTTYGTGAWKFTMPAALQFNVKRQALGQVRITDTGTVWYIGLARSGSGAAPQIYMNINASGGDVSATVPHTWANTDILELEIEWEIG